MQAALAVGQVQTPPSVIGMKQKSTQPENCITEGVWALSWKSQDSGKRGQRKKEKKKKVSKNQTQIKLVQKQSKRLCLTAAGLPCGIYLTCGTKEKMWRRYLPVLCKSKSSTKKCSTKGIWEKETEDNLTFFFFFNKILWQMVIYHDFLKKQKYQNSPGTLR